MSSVPDLWGGPDHADDRPDQRRRAEGQVIPGVCRSLAPLHRGGVAGRPAHREPDCRRHRTQPTQRLQPPELSARLRAGRLRVPPLPPPATDPATELTVAGQRTIEVPIRGMDCADCVVHVERAIAALPGVALVHVSLTAEKAVVQLDPHRVDLSAIAKAVEGAGYSCAPPEVGRGGTTPLGGFTRPVLTLIGVVFGAVLFVVVVGEWFGLFEAVTRRVPWPLGL